MREEPRYKFTSYPERRGALHVQQPRKRQQQKTSRESGRRGNKKKIGNTHFSSACPKTDDVISLHKWRRRPLASRGSGRSGVQLSVVPRPFALVSRGHTRAAGWGKKARWGERERERERGTKHTRERKEAADWGDRGQIERSRHFERSPPLYVWQRAFLMVKQRRLSSLFFYLFFVFVLW